MRTSVRAFQLGLVCFLIPFAFAFDPRLLGGPDLASVLFAGLSLVLGTAGWGVALVGYWLRPIRVSERLVIGATSAGAICLPAGSSTWMWAAGALVILGGWIAATRHQRWSGDD